MRKRKHTPGPWSINGDDSTMIGADDGKQMLAEALHSHSVKEWERKVPEAQANARLIAAAPELLAAAEQALTDLERLTSAEFAAGADAGTRDQLRTAIARARGEE